MKINIFSTSGGKMAKYLANVTQDFPGFVSWFKASDDYIAFDLETNVVDSHLDRVIYTAAFFRDGVAWIVFVPELADSQRKDFYALLNTGRFIIQNVKFERNALRKHGVILEYFYDTFLTEKLLNMGLDANRNGLDALIEKYIGVEISKDLQLSFNGCNNITDAQLDYALQDVIYLHQIMKLQKEDLAMWDTRIKRDAKLKGNKGLRKTNFWNHQFIKVIADMEYRGLLLDQDEWRGLYEEAVPKLAQAAKHLDAIVKKDFFSRAAGNDYIYAEDTFVKGLYTSSAKKLKLLQIIFPDIEKVSQVELKMYLQKHDPNWPEDLKPTSKHVNSYLSQLHRDKFVAIKLLLLNKTQALEQLYLINFKKEMIEQELLFTAGTVSINWNSSTQRKEIFQWVAPNLESTDRPHLEEVAYKHELIQTYLDEYQVYSGMVSKFGLGYIDCIESDGRIRTSFNPIINTGRISSAKPNILNIINDKRYRAAFKSGPGRKLVMNDYDGQELCLTALFSKEPTWIDAIKKGHDIHSINAENIFKKEWIAGKEDGCRFETEKKKCKCKEHKRLRQNAKAIEFGSLYGLSKYGLAFRIKCNVDEADKMLSDFFKQLPRVEKFLNSMSAFALQNLYSPELTLGACRFVDKRKLHYDKNSIKRTSANFAIQGAGASILKIATSLIYRHIKHMKHDAWIVLTPYDEIIMDVADEHAEYWGTKLKYYMELAGKIAFGNDLLRADDPIVADHWIH